MQRCAFLVPASCLLLTLSCATQRHQQQPSTEASNNSAVREIALPRFQSSLPEAPGREAFAAACLSCHSTTYVTMQPPLTAPKWEEVVVKMTKVYAAPIAPEQVPQIVQYLMTTKEAGNRELQDTLASTTAVEVPVAAPAQNAEQRTADLRRGEMLFAKNCASCHGPRGAGDGPSAASQLPRPTDLRSTRYASEALATAVTRGVPATAMPGFPGLSGDDLRAIVTYSQELYDATRTPPRMEQRESDRKQAEALYAQNCMICHGGRGGGDGPIAATAPRPPANFRLVQPTRSVAARIIADGVPATAMPPWKHKFNDAQRELLADYVRSFYVEGGEQD